MVFSVFEIINTTTEQIVLFFHTWIINYHDYFNTSSRQLIAKIQDLEVWIFAHKSWIVSL